MKKQLFFMTVLLYNYICMVAGNPLGSDIERWSKYERFSERG